MKASTYERYGPPDVLRIREIEIPIPRDNEVLVQVFATTVNRTDCAMLRAKPFIMRFLTGLFNPKRTILGTDFAGKVMAIGKEVTSFNVGDNIFGFEDTGLSTHAQYVCIPESKAISAMPQGVGYDQAAAALEGAHYAYNMLNKIKLKPSDNVLGDLPESKIILRYNLDLLYPIGLLKSSTPGNLMLFKIKDPQLSLLKPGHTLSAPSN